MPPWSFLVSVPCYFGRAPRAPHTRAAMLRQAFLDASSDINDLLAHLTPAEETELLRCFERRGRDTLNDRSAPNGHPEAACQCTS